MKIQFNIVRPIRDIGHCQLTYFSRNTANQKIYYCLQDQGEKYGGIRLMRTTHSEGHYEPSHEVDFLDDHELVFEIPHPEVYDSDYALKLKELCKNWITEKHKGN